jgi:WD40 repeat protein
MQSCAWSPDGFRLVSAGFDSTVRLWDSESGACLTVLAAHTGKVQDCAWSPDGDRIASASDDKTLIIWDANAGTRLTTLSGHSNSVSACVWLAGGRRIVSASADGTFRIWDAAVGVEIGPRFYQFWVPGYGSTWCAIDHQNNRILACDREAWRYLGWLVSNASTGWPEMLPAETFGPLPVAEAGE